MKRFTIKLGSFRRSSNSERPSESVPVDYGFDNTQNAPLENLPLELRNLILSILDLEELRALVRSSPIFHRDYIRSRKYLLCKSLETTLHSLTIDACAAYRSGSADFANARTRSTVTQFLESYQDRRSATQYSILTEDLTENDILGIVAFHFSVVRPLARFYANWALANLAWETNNQNSQCYETLSKTENARILRALYCFQLSCNLFGNGKYVCSGRTTHNFKDVEILTYFLDNFEPWEVEEIACILVFTREQYDKIFNDITWNVPEENLKLDQRPPTLPRAFGPDNSSVRLGLLNGIASRGLDLLHAVLFTTKDRDHLVSAMKQMVSYLTGHFLDRALDLAPQVERRRTHPSLRDQKQRRRDPLPFLGDPELDHPDHRSGDMPPFAWAQIWRGTYCNLYGFYLEEDAPRRWGYVFWDAVRLERTGAKEVLDGQWNDSWGDDDPRKYILL